MNFYSVNTCEKVKSGNILMYNNFLFCQLCILSNFILSTLYFVKFYFVNSEFCQLLFCQLCFGQLLFCQLCFGQLLFCQLCFGQLLFCQIYFDQLCVLSTLFCQLLFCQTMRSSWKAVSYYHPHWIQLLQWSIATTWWVFPVPLKGDWRLQETFCPSSPPRLKDRAG